MDFEGYSKHLLRRTGPYQVISADLEYAKIDQDGIPNTISINWLSRVAKGKRLSVHVMFDLRTKVDINLAEEVSIKKKKNFYVMKKVVGDEN